MCHPLSSSQSKAAPPLPVAPMPIQPQGPIPQGPIQPQEPVSLQKPSMPMVPQPMPQPVPPQPQPMPPQPQLVPPAPAPAPQQQRHEPDPNSLDHMRGGIWHNSMDGAKAEHIKVRLRSPECSMHEKQLVLDELLGNLPAVMRNRYSPFVWRRTSIYDIPGAEGGVQAQRWGDSCVFTCVRAMIVLLVQC